MQYVAFPWHHSQLVSLSCPSWFPLHPHWNALSQHTLCHLSASWVLPVCMILYSPFCVILFCFSGHFCLIEQSTYFSYLHIMKITALCIAFATYNAVIFKLAKILILQTPISVRVGRKVSSQLRWVPPYDIYWSWRESNPRPKAHSLQFLPSQSMLWHSLKPPPTDKMWLLVASWIFWHRKA